MSVNVATTVWSPSDGNGEYVQGASQALVDSTSVALVDASGVALVDDGTTITPVPQTTWQEDDSEA